MAAKSVVPLKFASVVSLASGVTFPFVTPSSRNFRMCARPLSSSAWFVSRTIVLKPAAADTCAMPAPINPQPSTPTVLTLIVATFACPNVQLATLN